MPSTNRNAFLAPARACLAALVVVAVPMPNVLRGQDRVVIVRHESTPEGDVIRAKADAALLMKQAELIGEVANAQRLDNMLKECDVRYKQMVARNQTKGTLETKYGTTFDVIRFNQQLAEIRSELEQKAVMQRTRVGDLTDEMNSLLEKFARQSINANGIPAMKTELTPEQLDAIFLTDGSNTFSGKTGKTKLEAFKWPFLIQRKEFQDERNEFDAQCSQAVKEINANGTASPETIMALLKKVEAIDNTLDTLPLSDNPSIRSVEAKWHKEAKAFLRELTRTLGNCSKLDSERLSKYIFQGRTLGELIDHLDSKGLRFSHPGEQDANLYASVFFIMRYGYQELEKGPSPPRNGDRERSKSGVIDAKPTRTPQVGGTGGAPFEDIPATRSMLVGFRYTTFYHGKALCVKSVQAIYRSKGQLVESSVFGKPSPAASKIIAKEGYAIGGLVTQPNKGAHRVDGFKVIFMRTNAESLDPHDSYESAWIGGRVDLPETKLGGDGRPIIGIFGACWDDLDSLGLVQEPGNR